VITLLPLFLFGFYNLVEFYSIYQHSIKGRFYFANTLWTNFTKENSIQIQALKVFDAYRNNDEWINKENYGRIFFDKCWHFKNVCKFNLFLFTTLKITLFILVYFPNLQWICQLNLSDPLCCLSHLNFFLFPTFFIYLLSDFSFFLFVCFGTETKN